jgi:hypothetical protein
MTLGIAQGKIVDLHSGGKMDFGPMKAAFGPGGDRHSRNMTENVNMAYDDMFADAPETVNMAAGAYVPIARARYAIHPRDTAIRISSAPRFTRNVPFVKIPPWDKVMSLTEYFSRFNP